MSNENHPAQNHDVAPQAADNFGTLPYVAQSYAAPPQTAPNYGTWPQTVPVMPATVALPAKRIKTPFKPDIYDFCFALLTFILGYICSRWVVFAWQGWGVALFTALYLISTTAYFMIKGIFTNSRTVWFWFAVTCLIGISYALFDNPGFSFVRSLFLFGAAMFYVILASGRTIMGNIGNYLLIDCLNAFILIPFRNFLNQYISFSVLRKGEKRGRFLPIIIGVFIAIVLSVLLIPMLLRADSGGFRMILRFFTDLFTIHFVDFLFYAFFATPIAAYIYGSISGSAHGRHTKTIMPESVVKKAAALKFVQPATIFIILGTVCVLYMIFILSQIPYFFSAFTGNRPDGWLIFSEYARQGFFELCGIAAINLAILIIVNVTSKKQRVESFLLKAFNIILALITLLLIATAFSKMALYIDAYGLTMPRLLPCIFMIFLAIVFVALIVLQKWEFSIVRMSLLTGAIMICVLCMSNPDALVVRYNLNRFLNGTLQEYDMEILHRAGKAGISPALDVFNKSDDKELRHEISKYLISQAIFIEEPHRSSLELLLAQEKLKNTISLMES